GPRRVAGKIHERGCRRAPGQEPTENHRGHSRADVQAFGLLVDSLRGLPRGLVGLRALGRVLPVHIDVRNLAEELRPHEGASLGSPASTMTSGPRPILWDLYEEHLDEAAFLWGHWERALVAANYTLDQVIEGPEERLLAHLDGLVLGGKPVAKRLLAPALDDDDPGKVFAAAWALVQAEDADHLELVLARLPGEKPPARAALGRALELSTRADL